MKRLIPFLLVVLAFTAGALVSQAAGDTWGVERQRQEVLAALRRQRLSTFERGQLITQCYQAAGRGLSSSNLNNTIPAQKWVLEPCLDRVDKMP